MIGFLIIIYQGQMLKRSGPPITIMLISSARLAEPF